jgi:integrase
MTDFYLNLKDSMKMAGTKTPKLRRHKSRNKGYVSIGKKMKYFKGTYTQEGPCPTTLDEYAKFTRMYEWEQVQESETLPTIGESFTLYTQFKQDRLQNAAVTAVRLERSKLRKVLRMVTPYLDDYFSAFTAMRFNEVRKSLLARRGRAENGSDISIRTFKTYWGYFTHFLKWAVAQGHSGPEMITTLRCLSPINRTNYPMCKKKKIVNAVDADHVKQTLPHLSLTMQVVVMTQMATGGRPTEILEMKWSNIDRTNAVWKYIPEHHKNEHREMSRTIFLAPEVQEMLENYQQVRPCPDEEYIFTSHESWAFNYQKQWGTDIQACVQITPENIRGGSITQRSLYQAIQRVCDKHKIPRWTPYQCRHFFAKEMLERLSYDSVNNGGSEHTVIETVASLLGHKNVDTSVIYTKRNEALARETIGNGVLPTKLEFNLANENA